MAARKNTGTRWTDETDRLLAMNWSTMTMDRLEMLLGFERSTIHRRARRLRELGVSLPEKDPVPIPGDVRRPKKPEPEPKPASTGVLGRRWPDDWFIAPPSLARLRAGR